MTIRECYEKLGGNYDEVFGRFRRDAMIEKFALKFLNDKSYEELAAALEQGDVEEAFRAAHTLKGVCANLSFSRLLGSASAVTELLRSWKLEEAKEAFKSVQEDYALTIDTLKKFSAAE